jgi:hypothetical protein
MMKHYLGRIDERNGEFEYSTPYLFTTKGSPARYADKVARDWRGSTKECYDTDQEGYWADCTLVFAGNTREILESEWNVLSKYIAVL